MVLYLALHNWSAWDDSFSMQLENVNEHTNGECRAFEF